jgi:uncharacterized protein (TIGR00730 family)
MPLRRVCVFCDPDPDAGPEHRELAASVGWLLADNGITLVYAGATRGAGGALAEAVIGAGAGVIAVVTAAEALESEIPAGLSERNVVSTIEEQRSTLASLSDGFLALPGAFGSLEELVAVWTWGQPGDQEKPCGLLNRADYYTKLLHSKNDALVERFVRETQRGMVIVDRDPAVLLRGLADFRPPETRRFQSYDDS